MRLLDLDPRWATDGRGTRGLTFLCPCCRRIRIAVVDPRWAVTGGFSDLSVVPSIDLRGSVPSHGHWGITGGEVSGA